MNDEMVLSYLELAADLTEPDFGAMSAAANEVSSYQSESPDPEDEVVCLDPELSRGELLAYIEDVQSAWEGQFKNVWVASIHGGKVLLLASLAHAPSETEDQLETLYLKFPEILRCGGFQFHKE